MNSKKSFHNLRLEDLIIDETPNYLLINKPPFLSSLADRNNPITLLSLIKAHHTDYQLCHRIDKETSGVVVVSKNNDAYKRFSMLLSERKIKKVYHAVVSGIFTSDNFEAEEPIFQGTNKSRIDFKSGKPSLTLISKIEAFKKHTLLKAFPVTGRQHQIRLHLAHHHFPIIADHAYGGEDLLLSSIKRNYHYKIDQEELPVINRVALHAFEIAFEEMDGKIVHLTATYPKDFLTLIKVLKKYN
jgi:23S rRNA pseudouridine955/2504/2580 synthase